jgi:hypothetical protein
MNPSTKGSIAEAVIAAEAVKLGVVVLRPIVEGRGYDLMFDVDGLLLRVQCKWGSRKGAVIVSSLRTSRLTPAGYVRTTYTAAEINAIALYCADLDRCYLLPIGDVLGQSYLHLRLTPAANHQEAAIRYAAQYELRGAIAQLGERRHGMAEAEGSSPSSSTS